MGDLLDVLIGVFVGALCGVIPLAFGLLTKHKIIAIVSVIVTGLSGVIFGLFEKSPFTAIGVAIIFVVLIFAKNKNKYAHHEDDNEHYLHDE